MKIRVKYDHWIPKRLKVLGITLYPFILVATTKEQTHPVLLRHEWVHVQQVRRVGWIWFYLTYLMEHLNGWLVWRDWDVAYRNISYEVEAYEKEESTEIPEGALIGD